MYNVYVCMYMYNVYVCMYNAMYITIITSIYTCASLVIIVIVKED